MGTPAFAVPTLLALAGAHEVVAVYTQPPRPPGRGKQPRKSPVHLAAERLRVEVRHPASLKGANEQASFAALRADIAVVAAYGLILPQPVLDAPRLGCLNLHASLLPRWRGAAPIQRAILAGDAVTGVTIMRMEAGLDTGPMLARQAVQVERKTAGELTEELAEVGATLIDGVLSDFAAFHPVAQPEDGTTYAKKLDKAETRLDFAQSAEQVERQVRAFAPVPGAWFELDGDRFRVLAAEVVGASPREGGDLGASRAIDAETPASAGAPGVVLDDRLTIACQGGAIRPTLVQRAGRPAMATAALLRGRSIPAETPLS